MASTNDFYRQTQDYGLPKRLTPFFTPYQVPCPCFCNIIHAYCYMTFLYLNMYRPLLLHATIKIFREYLNGVCLHCLIVLKLVMVYLYLQQIKVLL